MPVRSLLTLPLWLLTFTSSAPAQALDGVWRSRGYGLVLEIRGSSLQAFEVTGTTCLPSLQATRDSTSVAGREATFVTPQGQVFFVRSGGTPDHRRLHSDGAASDMLIDRIASRPAHCDRPTPDTPSDNFEVFARTWAEHYILFDQKQVNWQQLVEANRPKVTAATTPAELFDLMERMIAPFNDAHTFIAAPQPLSRRFRTLRPGTDRVMAGGPQQFRSSGMPALLSVTERGYVKDSLRSWCNNQVRYGHLNDSTGYLRIISFSGFGPQGTFASGLVALEAALDTIFSDPRLKGLVIDVRINFGGADPYGLAIASRLASTTYLGYVKEARADPVNREVWTPGDSSIVRPGSRPGFRGPVVELIGPLTISAGETFTQALMGRTPRVIRIGEPTQGVFSDVLVRRLPNGWTFGLPNEVFRTPEGATFDGPGIPPDIAMPVFADEDVKAGKDPAIERALLELWGK